MGSLSGSHNLYKSIVHFHSYSVIVFSTWGESEEETTILCRSSLRIFFATNAFVWSKRRILLGPTWFIATSMRE